MKKEDAFELLADLDERFITEAGDQKEHRQFLWKIKWAAAAACLILAVAASAYFTLRTQQDNRDFYKVTAAEIGKDTIQMGATMPSFLYCDEKKAIMYDYIGIWVYDFDKGHLTGFCDFRPINMTQIQGYPCVFVEASADGDYVRFYLSDESKKYLYDVEKDSCQKVTDYDSSFQISKMQDISDRHSLSNNSATYAITDDVSVSYILDLEDKEEDDSVTYGDLVILKENGDNVSKYRPFLK